MRQLLLAVALARGAAALLDSPGLWAFANATAHWVRGVLGLNESEMPLHFAFYVNGCVESNQVRLSWTFVNLHAIELTQSQRQRRVDGLKTPRHRADAATETASRRWRGAPEI